LTILRRGGKDPRQKESVATEWGGTDRRFLWLLEGKSVVLASGRSPKVPLKEAVRLRNVGERRHRNLQKASIYTRASKRISYGHACPAGRGLKRIEKPLKFFKFFKRGSCGVRAMGAKGELGRRGTSTISKGVT